MRNSLSCQRIITFQHLAAALALVLVGVGAWYFQEHQENTTGDNTNTDTNIGVVTPPLAEPEADSTVQYIIAPLQGTGLTRLTNLNYGFAVTYDATWALSEYHDSYHPFLVERGPVRYQITVEDRASLPELAPHVTKTSVVQEEAYIDGGDIPSWLTYPSATVSRMTTSQGVRGYRSEDCGGSEGGPRYAVSFITLTPEYRFTIAFTDEGPPIDAIATGDMTVKDACAAYVGLTSTKEKLDAFEGILQSFTDAGAVEALTNDWQIHTDARGFSFRYPQDWDLVEASGYVTVIHLQPRGATYAFEGSPVSPVSLVLRDDGVEDYLRDVASDRLSTVTIGHNTFTRLRANPPLIGVSYLLDLPEGGSLVVGDVVDEIVAADGGLPAAQADGMHRIVQSILASLKVSATNTSTVPGDWLTYTDSKQDFTFRYPPNFSIAWDIGGTHVSGLEDYHGAGRVIVIDASATTFDFSTMENCSRFFTAHNPNYEVTSSSVWDIGGIASSHLTLHTKPGVTTADYAYTYETVCIPRTSGNPILVMAWLDGAPELAQSFRAIVESLR